MDMKIKIYSCISGDYDNEQSDNLKNMITKTLK